ncbi:hypothetical protein BCD67_18310 [Oscillatoriales cyanobacterium USR001]|nr:hypothetical protein BCD67_18310 [Oscillatoriales cyanobacterium USR001]
MTNEVIFMNFQFIPFLKKFSTVWVEAGSPTITAIRQNLQKPASKTVALILEKWYYSPNGNNYQL